MLLENLRFDLVQDDWAEVRPSHDGENLLGDLKHRERGFHAEIIGPPPQLWPVHGFGETKVPRDDIADVNVVADHRAIAA
jgi:hypothetical protein